MSRSSSPSTTPTGQTGNAPPAEHLEVSEGYQEMELGIGQDHSNPQVLTFAGEDLQEKRPGWSLGRKLGLAALILLFGSALLACLFLAAGILHSSPSSPPDPVELDHTVLLISIDGFRASYLTEHADRLPHFRSLISEGVKASSMISCFPTKTFTNHYSIATGLYAESHGIINNAMFDPTTNASFSLSSPSKFDSVWWGGEPLWVTAEKQHRKAATFFWPGSEAEIKGVRPSYWLVYDQSIPYDTRVNKVLEWLDMEKDKRPSFITLYFENVDTQGHVHGPGSSQVATALSQMDQVIGQLLTGLKERDIYDSLHVIVVSDHGMAQLYNTKVIYIDDYIRLDEVQIINYSPVLMFLSKLGSEDYPRLYNQLKDAHPNLHVYWKQDLPTRYHLKNNVRVTPIVAVADIPWVISTRRSGLTGQGDHGYDQDEEDMHAIFIARGPKLKKGVEVEAFENIQVYNIVAHIMELAPAPNNGSLDKVKHIFA